MTKTLSVTDARKNLFSLIEEVQVPNSYCILTERGRAKAAIISAEDFESILETIEVVADFPELEKDVTRAYADLKKGTYWILNDSSTIKRKK